MTNNDKRTAGASDEQQGARLEENEDREESGIGELRNVSRKDAENALSSGDSR